MMREERAPEVASTCPACNSPVIAGNRFCEKCGEQIPPPSAPVQAPVCRSCGTPLLPNARFCDNCGDPVKKPEPPAPSPPASARPVSKEPVLPRGLIVTEEPVTVAAPHAGVVEPVTDEGLEPEPVQEVESWDEPEEESTEEPVQEREPGSEERFEEEPAEEPAVEPAQGPEDKFGEEPGDVLEGEPAEEFAEEPEEAPESVTEESAPAMIATESCTGPVDELLLGLEPEEPTSPVPQKRPAAATTTPKKEAATKTPAPRKPAPSKKTFFIIGLIAAFIVIAIALVALLPLLTGPGPSGTEETGMQATPVATVTTVVTTAPTPSPEPVETETAAPAPAVPAPTAATETPEQVDVLPPQYTLHFEVFKDVVTGDVTVSVAGPSRNVVKDIEVTVFHPDGTTDSDHLLPSQGMTEVTVTGTRSAERVVTTVLFYSGEQYKLIDRIVSFSRRT
ncbi:zinc ribbon domain-containing protein [Methanoregula sp.]|uniref:zinc ribbon domain-containing protein n=1 Tax=Methanoregula sp. TaxID=2052170 RepID=UPI0026173F8E|nr:zinc ribbon domain-containing protein [Methanoregula sp.]MDD5142987.1 zinc ribbon domain-containing protein [Methanoregula sp.]